MQIEEGRCLHIVIYRLKGLQYNPTAVCFIFAVLSFSGNTLMGVGFALGNNNPVHTYITKPNVT